MIIKMPNPINEHSTLMAKKVVGKFKEIIDVKAGFSAFFPRETTATLMVDVEVQRDNDTIAVDVTRFTDGNKSKSTRHSEHTYKPPFYKEEYDFSQDEIYMNTVALGALEVAGANQAIAKNAVKEVAKNRLKIERAIRKQQADVLQTGIVSLINGDSIDYRRKAASMVDVGAAQYWGASTSTPLVQFAAAGKFLREIGNSSGNTLNITMRSDAMTQLLSNDSMQQILESRRMDRAKIDMPQFNASEGMTFHGQIAAGDFVINLWTYEEKYTDADGNTKYYLDKGNVIILPNDFMGKTIFGGLPFMRSGSVNGVAARMPGVIEKDYLLRALSDEKTISSTLELTSAPLVVPFTIDKVYTLKVLA
ncbi:hypothetical protein CEPG_00016 [Cellulophaga phage phiSM]|uniref:major head protein n=1 Tax=Cellulophaga phage phiSM TaxID=756280 RepID=UPI0002C1319E|nr:major head protein [Cellulophaga phage phiSM]AGH07764.1 hypothetical protein CEPG_00016 [Cellulophaga phage phiSM]